MLPSGQELRLSLRGAWLLLFNRPEGMGYFDLSLSGFWRSFGVAVFLLPAFFITSIAEWQLILSETGLSPEDLPGEAYWLAQSLNFAIDWVTFPVLFALLAGWLGYSRSYVPFIIVRNWASLISTAPYALAGLLYVIGVIPAGIMVLFSLARLMIVAWYHFRIARIALGATVSASVGIVILDFVLSLLISELSGRLLGF
ncbi:hypothetical protein [Roseibium suaedae]|uniref:Yip1 domain-containing protein n=1 Tax=Roseibium suaedae TaxID=735517 RepID=A0A1M7A556_9HYPH|nr:hypothetical protein [Roseibium suaedae]SHL37723.1 hypothetical protein SAMN05444272_0429 [Roseibium suaedae]